MDSSSDCWQRGAVPIFFALVMMARMPFALRNRTAKARLYTECGKADAAIFESTNEVEACESYLN
jgi:hypothetical protein